MYYDGFHRSFCDDDDDLDIIQESDSIFAFETPETFRLENIRTKRGNSHFTLDKTTKLNPLEVTDTLRRPAVQLRDQRDQTPSKTNFSILYLIFYGIKDRIWHLFVFLGQKWSSRRKTNFNKEEIDQYFIFQRELLQQRPPVSFLRKSCLFFFYYFSKAL